MRKKKKIPIDLFELPKTEQILQELKEMERNKKMVRIDKNTWILVDKKADSEKRKSNHIKRVEKFRKNFNNDKNERKNNT